MRISTIFSCLLITLNLQAQQGHKIDVQIDGYTQDSLYLAYYLGDKQYIQDTVIRNAGDHFIFEGEELLDKGMYLIVMAPDNQFFDILIDSDDQYFSVHTQKEKRVASMQFENSDENELFYNYLNFLSTQRPIAQAIQQEIKEERSDKKKAIKQEELNKIDAKVKNYQKELIKANPASLTAAVIKMNTPLVFPDFEGTDEAINTQKWRWMQQHYFDNIDLADSRLLRTSFLFKKIDYFVQKISVQHPDSIIQALDVLLGKLQASEDNFKFYLSHYLGFYGNSKYVGMDAIYVHLVDNYYAKNLAPWVSEEWLQETLTNARRLRPVLIGKIAPNILMQRKDGSKLALHDVESPYTVLYFWRYDCSHCKKSMPYMKAFYDAFHDQGVEIFAACAKTRDEVPECWDYIEENEIGEWIHVVDPYGRSRFMPIYDLRITPKIFILDKDKKIISKRLGAEQLPDFFNQLLGTDIKLKEEDK